MFIYIYVCVCVWRSWDVRSWICVWCPYDIFQHSFIICVLYICKETVLAWNLIYFEKCTCFHPTSIYIYIVDCMFKQEYILYIYICVFLCACEGGWVCAHEDGYYVLILFFSLLSLFVLFIVAKKLLTRENTWFISKYTYLSNMCVFLYCLNKTTFY